ncbi:iron hydrogenase [Hanseniaspora valbyensis NRRL Y-1626]|uniref:Cytosolic Fe-S cluster assembly factor NAR1 n=1 Tax=Hanseniaspora valbyensis NRRL Y-1626 TaxID=766949 RepID=A0A1B7TBE5_9ASCO|nr:iron hydrogenase [Hanseniaspora valbyensis NRRL Y-1626]
MSSILTKEALNDFISPSQVCINPIKTDPIIKKQKKEEDEDEFVIEVGKEDDTPTKVNITLQDCLACSGCVTTSEELLLEQHSHDSFLKNYRDNLEMDDETVLLISIAPTCRISLMNYLKFETLDDLDNWFLQACVSMFAQKHEQQKLYVTSTQIGKEISNKAMLDNIFENNSKNKKEEEESNKKPLLTAVCPGVVLYIEKQHNNLTSNFIKIKPEMSALGQLIKDKKKNYALANNKIYHLAIMPCFDKKLESSKIEEDDVDCVLTPKEVINMFIDSKILLEPKNNKNIEEKKLSTMINPYGDELLAKLAWCIDNDELEAGNSSGGYAFKYIKEKKNRLLKENGIITDIVIEEGKNSDMVFYKLVTVGDEAASKKLMGSSCELYGFKNLQNLIRKIDVKRSQKKKKPLFKSRKTVQSDATSTNDSMVIEPKDCDFIELMACPGGCINGGGLLLPLDSAANSNSKKRYESLSQMNKIYLAQFTQKLNKTFIKGVIDIDDNNNTVSVKIIGHLYSENKNSDEEKKNPPLNTLKLDYKIERKEDEEEERIKEELKSSSTAVFEEW